MFTPFGWRGSVRAALLLCAATAYGQLSVPGCVLADGTVMQPYSDPITGIQGKAPFAFVRVSGTMPPGLAIHATTGVISGTPVMTGGYQFGIRITDADGFTATPICNISIRSSGPLLMAVNPGTIPPVRLGEAITPFTVKASGGFPPYTYNIQLPPGHTISWATVDPSTGTVTGTPPEGFGGVNIEARDSVGNYGQASVSFHILHLSWTSDSDGYVGEAYTNLVHALGFPNPPTTYSIVGGSLPPGLTIATDGSFGKISGTPTQAGTFTFTVRAALNATYWASRQFTFKILPNLSRPFDLSDLAKYHGFVGAEFYAPFRANGGVSPITYTLHAGSLPPGLALVGASVYGTPTTPGSYTFTLRAADSSGLSTTRQYTIVIKNPLTVLPASLPNGTVEQPYAVTITATGGTPPYFFYVEGGVPNGLDWDEASTPSQLKIFGKPVLPGTYNLRVRAVDTQGVEGKGNWNIVIAGSSTLSLSPTSLPNGIAGVAYHQSIFAGVSNGDVAYPLTWGVSNGSLPPGMSLDTSLPDRVTLTGIPQSAGVYSFRLTGTDTQQRTGGWTYTLTIDSQNIQIQPSLLPAGTVSVPYTAQFTATGGTGPYTFQALNIQGEIVISAWVTPDGKLQFTPSQAGLGRMLLKATDSTGATGERSIELLVAAAELTIQPATLPPPAIHQPYSQTLTATGGTAPYTFSLVSGSLPAGMTLGTGGQITGSPQQAGNFTFGVQAQGAGGEIGGRAYSFFVAGADIALGPASLPDAVQGQPYAAQVNASGGTAPYTFLLAGGMWDAGLQLSASGQITGSPQSVGTLTPLIEATDAQGSRGSRTFQIVIRSTSATALDVQPALLPAATVGTPYQAALNVTNGQGPFTFSITVGALPTGLTLSANGTLQGTPTVLGTFPFTVQAQDAQNATGTRNLQVTVNGAAITVTPSSLADAILGQPYAATIGATGGVAPYTFAVAFGQLTHGLQLAPNGSMSGTPAGVPGLIEVMIRATDANGSTGTRAFQIEVTDGSPPEPVAITTTELPPAQRDQYYQQPLEATGGSGPYAWTLASGALPNGMQLTPAGILQGTPSVAGTFAISVQVAAVGGQTATRAWSLTVIAPPETNTLAANPAALFYSLGADGSGETSQCLALFTTQSGTAVSFHGPAWLQGTPVKVNTPGFLCVKADPSGFAPGTHTGTVVLTGGVATSAQTLPADLEIPVTMVILPPAQAVLEVAPLVLKGTAVQGSGPLQRQVVLTNGGGQSIAYTMLPADSWVKAPSGGNVPAGVSQAVGIELDPAGLAPGVYASTLLVQNGAAQTAVQLELVVSGAPGKLALSQSGIELVSWFGGAPVVTQISALNLGTATLTPEAEANTTSGGNWLTITSPNAPLTAGNSVAIPIAADPAGLAPGRYTGGIAVQAEEAANGPQYAAVGLTVLPAGTPLPADAALSGVALTPAAPHGVVQINVSPGGTLGFQTTISSGAGWLNVIPAQGLAPANGSLTLQLTASHAGLSPGLYFATLAVGFSDGVIRSIPVEFFVPAAGPLQARAALADCSGAASFVAHLLSPTPGFAVRAGRAVTVRVQAENCDGLPATGLSVAAHYGSQSVTLLPRSAGVWEGTWFAPANTGSTPVQLQAVATRGQGSAMFSRQFSVSGQILANGTAEPMVTAVVGAANPTANGSLAPGGWVTIFGLNLAAREQVAAAAPLPETLGGVEVRLGDWPLRLYYAGPRQVNGVVPAGIEAATSYQLVLRRDGVAAAPVEVALAPLAPGLFTLNQQGSGQAAALLAGTGVVVGPASPVARGQVVELYATGLGAVSNAPADGAAASLDRLSPALVTPQVFIGGRAATVWFAGLAPGTVGLYQINVEIPADAPLGDAIELRLVQNGASSNVATIALR